MGWGRTFLLGDIGNRLDIADAEKGISILAQRVKRGESVDLGQEQRIAVLEKENEELKLYMASLARILMSKGVLMPGDLEVFVRIVEQENDDSE